MTTVAMCSLAGACAVQSSGPQPIVLPAQPPQPGAGEGAKLGRVLRGHVLGSSGKPLPAAHARLLDDSGKTVDEVPAGPDGAFTLPIGKLHRLGQVTFSGVDHRVERALLVEDERVEVEVRLGTYRAPARIDDVRLRLMAESAPPRPMQRQPDGTFVVDFALPDGAHAYELTGLNVEGHVVNGTMGTGYRYDGDGDYETLFEVAGGRARIVFDPKKLPAAGQRGSIAFSNPTSASAKLSRIAAEVDAASRARAVEPQPNDPPPSAAALEEERAALLQRIEASAGADAPSVVRRAADVAKFVLPAATWSASETAAAKKLLTHVEPGDPVWSHWGALPNVIGAVGAAPEVEAYATSFVDRTTDTKAAGEVLVGLLAMSHGQPDRVRPILAALRGARFARFPYFRFLADSADPDRVLAVGKKLPSFSFPALVGDKLDAKKPLTPKSLEGKIFLIDLWATWCKPCVAELPAMTALYEKYATGPNAKRFGMLSISLDGKPEDVAAFRKDKAHAMPWLHGFSGQTDARKPLTGEDFGIPLYILVDEQGKILASSPELRAGNAAFHLEKALRQPALRQ